MPTPLEGQILSDFENRLAASDAISVELAAKLMELVRSDRVPTPESLLEATKTNVGDQPV